ncbi:ParB/RepB/Spo0J family partition protein [Actinomadura flavalba]|uniref:ParB/RepB/Spo0J family partition protein n=1 Tax=Actinomadura flavalba TaxID=1120938 RepID=UPI000369B490|nr:ParB N-terminal domain-containing protein [Actinomadura flavalba]
MTEAAVIASDHDDPNGVTEQDESADSATSPPETKGQSPVYTERPMIPVELLTAHPGNVREDKQADQAFCKSVAAAGIVTPLEIAAEPEGGYRVVDGNIRLDAALKVGLEAVPYFFSDTGDEEGLQFLHMLITSRYRKSLNVHEEAAALFAASEAGLTRTQIRKTTGLSRDEVRDGVRAGGLNGNARELVAELDYEWTLEELALLAPYQDDPDALEYLARTATYSPLKYAVQRLEDSRARERRHAARVAELEASGLPITAERPQDAVSLRALVTQDGQAMDADAHADCPGRGAVADDQPYRGDDPADPLTDETENAAATATKP